MIVLCCLFVGYFVLVVGLCLTGVLLWFNFGLLGCF